MNYNRSLSNYFEHKTDPTKVVVALLAGLAVGAILGVLFAPDSGEEIRSNLADRAKGLANDAKDRFQSVRDRYRPEMDRLADEGSEMVKNAKSKARTAAADAKDYTEGAINTVKSKAKNVSVDQNGSIQGI